MCRGGGMPSVEGVLSNALMSGFGVLSLPATDCGSRIRAGITNSYGDSRTWYLKQDFHHRELSSPHKSPASLGAPGPGPMPPILPCRRRSANRRHSHRRYTGPDHPGILHDMPASELRIQLDLEADWTGRSQCSRQEG